MIEYNPFDTVGQKIQRLEDQLEMAIAYRDAKARTLDHIFNGCFGMKYLYEESMADRVRIRAELSEARFVIEECLKIADKGAFSEYGRFYDIVEILDDYMARGGSGDE